MEWKKGANPECGERKENNQSLKEWQRREKLEKKRRSHLTWLWFTVGLPHATPYGSECRITPSPLSLNSLEAELLVYFHIRIELLSASISWNEREEKGKKKTNLTNSVRALLLTNLLCPRDPAGCAAMLPAALFRKVTFASPSVRLLTAFPQKWVSLCLPEIAGEQNKSRFNE